jgi:hypothetical protein
MPRSADWHLPFWSLWTAALAREVVYKPLPQDPPLFRRRVDWFRQNRAFSIHKAQRDLGYKPKVGLENGLARTARWDLEKGICNFGELVDPANNCDEVPGSIPDRWGIGLKCWD